MTLKERFEGLALVGKNAKTSETLLKSTKKIDKVLGYMLMGRPVTGAIMMAKFNVYSYRDVIYDLKKKGYEISRKEVKGKHTEYTVWWLSDFSENFVMERMQKVF